MERFGDYLKAQREKKSIRLEEIASITKIHLHSLELLEANQWEQLPPEPFIRGFITAYAKYVGLDAKETIARYLEELGHKASDLAATSPQSTPIPNGDNPSDVIQNAWQLPTKKIAGAVAAMAVVGLLGVFIYLGKNSSEHKVSQITDSRPHTPETVTGTTPETAPLTDDARKVASPLDGAKAPETVSAETKPAVDGKLSLTASPLNDVPKALFVPPAPPAAPVTPPVAAKTETPAVTSDKVAEVKKEAPADAKAKPAEPKTATAAASPLPSPNAADAPAGSESFAHDISIEGKARTWIKIVIDEKMPVEYFLPKGEKATYKAKNKIKVVLGDSTGAVVTYNGEVNKGKKFKGTIYSYIFPANARFPQDIPKRTTTTESEDSGSDSNVDPLLQ